MLYFWTPSNLIAKYQILEQLYRELIVENTTLGKNDFVITDTFAVKSMDGSQGLGRNPTDRGRKGLKVSLICDRKLVTHAVHVVGANIHDAKILPETIDVSMTDLTGLNCLADSGYAGRRYIDQIEHKHKIHLISSHLISKPKRTRSPSKMSHHRPTEEMTMLNQYRNRIERLNGNIRGLMIKYTKTVDSYRTYLYLALLCITCYQLFVHK